MGSWEERASWSDTKDVVVEYVGGPFTGRREVLAGAPEEIPVPGTERAYRRSVRCADDGALRYVWETDAPRSRPRSRPTPGR